MLLSDKNGESGGLKNAEILQVVTTNITTIEKVKKKFVQLGLRSALEIESPILQQSQQLNKADNLKIQGYLETIFCTRKTLTFYHQDEHSFDLILFYPLNKEFLNQNDLKQKIAQFYNYLPYLLEPEQYILKFKVHLVRVGYSAKYYLIGFSGTVSGEYLEIKTTELINLLKGVNPENTI
ncbi:MAG: hypothetical protein QNJ60_00665 [Xenococcaceae cyanobacterium MO_188.B19]|nr:hypothetical protein [Xenococcaceae cyanobacterium MO_188.B19]